MNKLQNMLAFVAVVEANGFAVAARKQKISIANISRRVSQLERQLGVQLLRRTTRQLSLTEIGNQYYEQCKKTLSELAEIEAAISEGQNDAVGDLHIMSTPQLCLRFLLPKLAEFMEQNPKLQIKLEIAERLPDFNQSEVDLFFGGSFEGTLDIVRRRICTTRYILAASPDYFKKYGTPKKPQDLSEHRYIAHMARLEDSTITFNRDKKIFVKPTLWLNNTILMKQCAMKGMGIVNLHDYVIADVLANKQLVEILPEYQKKSVNVYLYYKKTKYLQAKIRRFIDFYAPTFSV